MFFDKLKDAASAASLLPTATGGLSPPIAVGFFTKADL
jgi:hypothetical protein